MRPLNAREYKRYAKSESKSGFAVLPADSSAARIRAGLYEADRERRRHIAARAIWLLFAGAAIGASAMASAILF